MCREMAMNLNQAAILNIGSGLMGLCLLGYIVGPPVYWHFMEALTSSTSTTCPPCLCACSSPSHWVSFSLFYAGLSCASFTDCAEHDPEVSKDTEKYFAELLTEELKLQEAKALENQWHADMALLEVKKLTSQYQKEAEKSNSGMETCEEAREKAEAALQAEKKLTALRELRAHQKGWSEGVARSGAQSQGAAQAL